MEQKYTISEGALLPSKGLIYDKPVKALVECRSMTARDEMKRLSPSVTPYKTLADIIEGCLLEKPAVSVYDMAIGDYEFLLHKVRIITYGDEYKMGVQCPFCGEMFDAVAHLDELEIKEFDQAKFEALRNLKLPVSGHTIGLKFQTPRMLDDIDIKAKDYKRKYKDASVNLELLALLTTIIDTVDGVKMTPYDLEAFINKLPAKDMYKIVTTEDELNACVGIKNDIMLDCPNCGGEVKTFFRFGTEFFRPTTI